MQNKQLTNRQGVLLLFFLVLSMGLLLAFYSKKTAVSSNNKSTTPSAVQSTKQSARIMCHGDLLYHDGLYMSALQADGSYDFSENFTYVKPWFDQADLVIGDFEGTISPDKPLAGYPLFNAPQDLVTTLKNTGYDVLDLAHNHILDSGISGLRSTAQLFEQAGITPIGIYTHQSRQHSPLTIKTVKGIKIALLAYAYGFNGIEASISQKDYNDYLSDLNENQMEAEIKRAEEEADITIVMPQMGIEYQLEPTEAQVTRYHKMIDWGADIIFGGHPHVVEPAEVVKKGNENKLIIYSMGNFISNQRLETMDGVDNAIWTERGILMDVTIEKRKGRTRIQTALAHPTWVSRQPKGTYSPEGYPLYRYQTWILDDFILGGKERQHIDQATQERIDRAYQEMNEHVHLNWPKTK